MLRHSKRSMVIFSFIESSLIVRKKNDLTPCNFSHDVCRAAAMTLRTVLLSLQALMASPEPDDPQDAVVAKQYKENPEIFVSTAEHWTSTYAGGNFFLIIKATLRKIMHYDWGEMTLRNWMI